MADKIKSVRDLKVYQLAFETAMEKFHVSKSFPKEELYSLTDQVRQVFSINMYESCRRLAKA